MIDEQHFRKVLERFTSTLVDPVGLDTVLEQLGERIAEVLSVAGAGVMLEDKQGNLRFVSTSDERLRQLEELQIELDEGPCLAAFRTGETVISPDLTLDGRFPRFAQRASAVGIAAVYSFPLLWRDTVTGALNLYRSEPGDFSGDQIEAGRTFAQVAAVFSGHTEEVLDSRLLIQQLQQALDSRVLIEQAKGYVAAIRGVSPDQAFVMLRRRARNHGDKLVDVARGVVSGELRVEELPPAT